MPIWPVKPIHNASDVSLDKQPGTLPNMAESISNWFQLVSMEHITKTVVNFNLVETTTAIQFQGVVMTEPKRKLAMASNGQRLWRTKTLYCFPSVALVPDDVVVYRGVQYRVLASENFSEYGYIGYGLCEDYTGSGPEVTS